MFKPEMVIHIIIVSSFLRGQEWACLGVNASNQYGGEMFMANKAELIESVATATGLSKTLFQRVTRFSWSALVTSKCVSVPLVRAATHKPVPRSRSQHPRYQHSSLVKHSRTPLNKRFTWGNDETTKNRVYLDSVFARFGVIRQRSGAGRATIAVCAVKCCWRAFDAHQFGISKTQC